MCRSLSSGGNVVEEVGYHKSTTADHVVSDDRDYDVSHEHSEPIPYRTRGIEEEYLIIHMHTRPRIDRGRYEFK